MNQNSQNLQNLPQAANVQPRICRKAAVAASATRKACFVGFAGFGFNIMPMKNHEINAQCPVCGCEYDTRLHGLWCPVCGHHLTDEEFTLQQIF